MAKDKLEKTNALRLLDRKKVPYRAYTYPCEEFTDGEEVARLLGLPPGDVCKTLVTLGKSGGHYVFVLPVDRELDRKKAAALVGEKSLHTSTGWVHLGRDGLWEEALAAAGIPVGMLPELLDCGEPVGPLLPGPAEALGLPPGIPVATGAMDQTAAALAAGCVAPGAVTETTGTALVAAACTEAPVFAEGHHVTIYRHALAGKYLYLPIGNTAGMALRWFRDEFCRDLPADGGYAALDAQAAKVPCGSDGLVFLPFLAGSVDPDACPEARAVFFGATLSTTRAHFARSVMESVAFLLRDFFALLEGLGCPVRTVASLGGGARSGRSRPTCAAGPSPFPPAPRPPPGARPCWPGGPGG